MALGHSLRCDITALPLINPNSLLEGVHSSLLALSWHDFLYAAAVVMVFAHAVGHQYVDNTCVQKSAQRAVMVWSCCLPSQYLP